MWLSRDVDASNKPAAPESVQRAETRAELLTVRQNTEQESKDHHPVRGHGAQSGGVDGAAWLPAAQWLSSCLIQPPPPPRRLKQVGACASQSWTNWRTRGSNSRGFCAPSGSWILRGVTRAPAAARSSTGVLQPRLQPGRRDWPLPRLSVPTGGGGGVIPGGEQISIITGAYSSPGGRSTRHTSSPSVHGLCLFSACFLIQNISSLRSLKASKLKFTSLKWLFFRNAVWILRHWTILLKYAEAETLKL